MKYASENNLEYSTIGNLLQLLQLLCPNPNKLPKTHYKIKHFFEQQQVPSSCRTFCTKCHNYEANCGCTDIASSTTTGYLVQFSIYKPLQAVLTSKFLASYIHAFHCIQSSIMHMFNNKLSLIIYTQIFYIHSYITTLKNLTAYYTSNTYS